MNRLPVRTAQPNQISELHLHSLVRRKCRLMLHQEIPIERRKRTGVFTCRLRRIEAAEDDPTLFTQLDSEFHLDLARCSRNPLIVRMYQQVNMVRLHAQWNRMKQLILSKEKTRAYNQQHRALYEALRHRDVQGAVDQITRHLEQARQDLIGAESG